MLYDFVHCPHRLTMDCFGDAEERDPVNPFVKLLWEKGSLFEKEFVGGLGTSFLDLSIYVGGEKVAHTQEAMERGEPLIYGGRIEVDDLLGEPDLLRKEGRYYIPGDIKSGAGEEGPFDDKKPKKHYAVQLALYVDILERIGCSAGRNGFVWDINGDEVNYDLTAPQGPRTPENLWKFYQRCLASARVVVGGKGSTLPAYAGVCKLCHWYTACTEGMRVAGDLTLIPELGRSNRDKMIGQVRTVEEFAATDPHSFFSGKKTVFPGLGPDRLLKFHSRAKLLTENGAAYLRQPVILPMVEKELFFDIESDPMRDMCYLHGFVERTSSDNSSELYVFFFAETPTPKAEKQAFADSVAYLRTSDPCALYYYSKYERTVYRRLRKRYPDVIDEAELEKIFNSLTSIDLYSDVVCKATEWPTSDFSIKTLAQHLVFNWRDTHPSGAASIEWFHQWVETGDPEVRQRILHYNEDDCRATRVLLDGIRELREGKPWCPSMQF